MVNSSLDEYLKSLGEPNCEGFVPRAVYNEQGDCIFYQTVDDASVAEYVDEFLTLYRSHPEEKLIGWQLKNIQYLVQHYDEEPVLITSTEDDGGSLVRVEVKIGDLFLLAYDAEQKNVRRRLLYSELFTLSVPTEPVSVRIPA